MALHGLQTEVQEAVKTRKLIDEKSDGIENVEQLAEAIGVVREQMGLGREEIVGSLLEESWLSDDPRQVLEEEADRLRIGEVKEGVVGKVLRGLTFVEKRVRGIRSNDPEQSEPSFFEQKYQKHLSWLADEKAQAIHKLKIVNSLRLLTTVTSLAHGVSGGLQQQMEGGPQLNYLLQTQDLMHSKAVAGLIDNIVGKTQEIISGLGDAVEVTAEEIDRVAAEIHHGITQLVDNLTIDHPVPVEGVEENTSPEYPKPPENREPDTTGGEYVDHDRPEIKETDSKEEIAPTEAEQGLSSTEEGTGSQAESSTASEESAENADSLKPAEAEKTGLHPEVFVLETDVPEKVGAHAKSPTPTSDETPGQPFDSTMQKELVHDVLASKESLENLVMPANYEPPTDEVVSLSEFPELRLRQPDIQLQESAVPHLLDFVREAKQMGFDVLIRSGYRSYEEQEKIHVDSPNISAPAGESHHQTAYSVDMVVLKQDGREVWMPESLIKLAVKYGIVHPMDWDRPHFVVLDGIYEGATGDLIAAGFDPNNSEAVVDAILMKVVRSSNLIASN